MQVQSGMSFAGRTRARLSTAPTPHGSVSIVISLATIREVKREPSSPIGTTPLGART